MEVKEMNKIERSDLTGYCLFVTSTFGNGEPPAMAAKFSNLIDSMLTKNDLTKSSRIELGEISEGSEKTSGFKRKSTLLRKSKKGGTFHQRMSLKVSKDLPGLK